MSQQNLLVELLVEELPPKALKKLGEAFGQQLVKGLVSQGLVDENHDEHKDLKTYASPRRLALWLKAVKSQANDHSIKQKLMPASIGLDAQGQPTPALIKKLQSLGVDTADTAQLLGKLQSESDGKTQQLFYSSLVKGASLQQGLQKALQETIEQLPIPKVMQYQLHSDCDLPGWNTVGFVRPAHGLVALHGSDVIGVHVLGLKAGNTTQGHRFEAATSPLHITHADDYARILENQGAVIASYEDRALNMLQALRDTAKQMGCRLEIEPTGLSDQEALALLQQHPLVQEVNALVERPNVLRCEFEEVFLQVPQECLILTMKANQKYFPLLNADGQLSHRFLIVSNIHPKDPGAVIAGNERVVRPRLSDAKFFFDQDRKKSLESRVTGLNKVVYHNLLGTQGERMQRVSTIAQTVAQALVQADSGLTSIQGVSLVEAAVRASRLAKTDLLTDMVGEFPELQGIMGRYYALHDGENPLVAQAIAEHYQPRFAGDALPENEIGLVAAIADKMETLVGMFGIGNLPSGDKDPFALRRHALGVTRILVERKLKISLSSLIDLAYAAFEPKQIHAFDKNKLETFFHERLIHYLENEGRAHHHVLAVLNAQSLADWCLLKQSLDAVEHFSQLPQSQALAAANKRITNILKKTTDDVLPQVDANLLHESAERHLYEQLQAVSVQADAAYAAGDYTGSLQQWASLREPVDTFFNDVMVNAQDQAIKNNRLGLLKLLHTRMNRIADLSHLAS